MPMTLTDILQLMPSNDGQPLPNKLVPVTNITSNATYLVNKDYITGIVIRNKINYNASPEAFPIENTISYEGEQCYVIDIILNSGSVTFATKNPDEIKIMLSIIPPQPITSENSLPPLSDEAANLNEITNNMQYIISLMSKMLYPPSSGYVSLFPDLVGYNGSNAICINKDKIVITKIYNNRIEHENGSDFMATISTISGQKFTMKFKSKTDLYTYMYWYLPQCFTIREDEDAHTPGGGIVIEGK